MRPFDTSPDAHRIQLAIYRRLSANERLALALRMADELQAVVRAGVRMRHPELDEDRVEIEARRINLGSALFAAAFPAGRQRAA
jgi:hypothetical protein